ncbi:fungal-specific transcription factor domain-containing protein [Phyllosticta capitalensis]
MVLEIPLLRVSRPVAACSRCRSAKVKCDGKLPACTACEKSGRANECSSTNDQFARGKERSYVATLEARIERLEKKLAETKQRRQSSVTMSDSDAQATPRPFGSPEVQTRKPKVSEQKAARRKEEADINDLVSDFGLLSVNATARDFYGFTSAMSYARLILSASSKEELPAGMTKPLPPRYAVTPLIQHYIDTIHVLLPFFEETTFYRSVDAVFNTNQQKATSWDHWTLRMVLAISSISFSEQRGDVHYTDALGHVNAALEHSEHVLRPGSVASIQALLLLTQYAMLDPHHFDSWTLIGAASRTMVDLGMHQDPSKSAAMPKATLELRRRVFHCLYAMDRETSLVQTRAFSFSDDSANVAFPFQNGSSPKQHSEDNHWIPPSFESALDLFRLRQLQSEWYTTLFQSGREAWQDPYPEIWRIYNHMTSWFSKASRNASPVVRDFLELELLYSYVYILSQSPKCPHVSDYAQHLIFEHCVSYASKLLAILSEESSKDRPPVTFYDAMRVYITGRHFVDVLSSNQEALLSGHPPPQGAYSSVSDESVDPHAQGTEVLPPAFPGVPGSQNQAARAVAAINNFTAILSQFGLRFGYANWRDRFQQDSSGLLSHLYMVNHQRQERGYSGWADGTETASTSPYSYFDVGSSPPPTTQPYGYSEARPFPQAAEWPGSRPGSNRRIYTIGQPQMPLPVTTALPVTGDMGQGTAWETLPGGSLNARFS